jgi:hypothetical protein
MQTYTNSVGEECVLINYEDGTSWSGLKSAYDELKANEAAAK